MTDTLGIANLQITTNCWIWTTMSIINIRGNSTIRSDGNRGCGMEGDIIGISVWRMLHLYLFMESCTVRCYLVITERQSMNWPNYQLLTTTTSTVGESAGEEEMMDSIPLTTTSNKFYWQWTMPGFSTVMQQLATSDCGRYAARWQWGKRQNPFTTALMPCMSFNHLFPSRKNIISVCGGGDKFNYYMLHWAIWIRMVCSTLEAPLFCRCWLTKWLIQYSLRMSRLCPTNFGSVL